MWCFVALREFAFIIGRDSPWLCLTAIKLSFLLFVFSSNEMKFGESCSSPTGSFLAVNVLPNWQATKSPPAGQCWQSQTMILACQLFASFELTGVEMA